MKQDVRLFLTGATDLPGGLFLAATVHAAEDVDPGAPVLFLFPGAGYGRRYFDLQVEGFAGYSQANHHAAAGVVVVTVDHLGVGDSSLAADGDLLLPLGETGAARFTIGDGLTLQTVAMACDAGVRAALQGLRAGTLVEGLAPLQPAAAVGVGQSMGGHVVAAAQAAHATFDAVGALGSSFTQTRLALQPGRRHPIRNVPLTDLMQAVQRDSDMGASFHWPDEPAALVAADRDLGRPASWRTLAIPRFASALMQPGVLAREAAAIRTPVFLGYGEIDVTLDPMADATMFRSTCDLTLSIVPQMAHMHNFAATRARLWRRLEAFVQAVALDGDGQGD